MGAPIDYIDRMLAFHPDEPPYRWAAPEDALAPAGPPVPADETTVVLVSLAGVRRRDQAPYDLRGDTTIRRVPLDAARSDLAVDHFGFKIERAAEDVDTVAPFAALRALAADGRIAAVADHAVCAMGATYSQRRVVTELAPAVVEAVLGELEATNAGDAGAALAVIVPACPLDHQTAGLLARAVEAAGVRTLVLSGARDVSDRVAAPRTVYLHAPLGWLLGLPGDATGQRERLAAAVAAGAALPGTGELVDLDPAYPTGATGTPHSSAHPELVDWESREFVPGYDTGAHR